MPQPYYCEQLGTPFDKTVQELGLFCDTDENKVVNISEGPSAPPCLLTTRQLQVARIFAHSSIRKALS